MSELARNVDFLYEKRRFAADNGSSTARPVGSKAALAQHGSYIVACVGMYGGTSAQQRVMLWLQTALCSCCERGMRIR